MMSLYTNAVLACVYACTYSALHASNITKGSATASPYQHRLQPPTAATAAPVWAAPPAPPPAVPPAAAQLGPQRLLW
jgi:hypothetical protein